MAIVRDTEATVSINYSFTSCSKEKLTSMFGGPDEHWVPLLADTDCADTFDVDDVVALLRKFVQAGLCTTKLGRKEADQLSDVAAAIFEPSTKIGQLIDSESETIDVVHHSVIHELHDMKIGAETPMIGRLANSTVCVFSPEEVDDLLGEVNRLLESPKPWPGPDVPAVANELVVPVLEAVTAKGKSLLAIVH